MELDKNTFAIFLKDLFIDGQNFKFFDVANINEEKYSRLPFSIRIIFESAVRNCDEFQITSRDVKKILNWPDTQKDNVEIAFLPSRVIFQDFTCVPALIDFAAMRDVIEHFGGDPNNLNPVCPCDLVIDQSIQVESVRKLINVPSISKTSNLCTSNLNSCGDACCSLHQSNIYSQAQFKPNKFIQTKQTCNNSLNQNKFLSTQNVNCNTQKANISQFFTGPKCFNSNKSFNETSMTELNQNNLNENQILIESNFKECPFHYVRTECADTLEKNQNLEFERNQERLEFLKWGSRSFQNTLIVPPGNEIPHQVNLECLARIVFSKDNILYPDSLVGTDSHTTMINGLGVVGWGVGGIETESVMLGQAITMSLPQVIGYKIIGKLNEMCTSTDVVLTITKHLRQIGVENKFVEFFGAGVSQLSIVERTTIANMCPEYGAIIAYFAVDEKVIQYLLKTGRSKKNVKYIKKYLKKVKLFKEYENDTIQEPDYTEIVELDLGTIIPCVSGPKRSQDKTSLFELKNEFLKCLTKKVDSNGFELNEKNLIKEVEFLHENVPFKLKHGSIVVAEITSCTNTSNPSVMLAAGLLAKKANDFGLKVKPYVKTSLSPGIGIVTDYLTKSRTLSSLESLGFKIVGYGCKTCIENNQVLSDRLASTIEKNELIAVGVLSGNRNFEGRINPSVRANYLASPPLVIAYAIAGRIDIDFENEPLGYCKQLEKEIYLKDIWPTRKELYDLEINNVMPEITCKLFEKISIGNNQWNSLNVPNVDMFPWNSMSTYIRKPKFFQNMTLEPSQIEAIKNARVLLYLGDWVTTDHISPAGSISRNCPAAKYLIEKGLVPREFNSYGSRRGNDEIMTRGTFSNIRISNKLLNNQIGPKTIFLPTGTQLDIFEAAMKYKNENIPVILLAGKEYGSGSSRDWSVKGPWMLGIKAIIAESYDKIHRSNLIVMGIIPFQFINNQNAETLRLNGKEVFNIEIDENFSTKEIVNVKTNTGVEFKVLARIDTNIELNYIRHGGLLNYIIRKKLLWN